MLYPAIRLKAIFFHIGWTAHFYFVDISLSLVINICSVPLFDVYPAQNFYLS